jgi:two-component system sensor histidine kinase ChvG
MEAPEKERIERTMTAVERMDEAAAPRAGPDSRTRSGEKTSSATKGKEQAGKPKRRRRSERAEAPPDRHRRHSPLRRRILALNILVLVVPVLGLLHLGQYRETLIISEAESLRAQARAFALSLASTAVVTTRIGEERLLPEMTRHLMRVLLSESGLRARIFAPRGELLADSRVLVGPGGRVQVVELDDGERSGFLVEMDRFFNLIMDWLPFQRDLPPYLEAAMNDGRKIAEVKAAYGGESPGMARIDHQGRLVISVAVPIQRYRKILGALMISRDGSNIESAVRARRADVLIVFAIAVAVSILLSIYLSGTIARPVRKLAEAADRVRFGKGRQIHIPDFTKRGDEIGDLSASLRDMTAALWNRMDAIERFAADVAHEIKNPLTSLRSAVETVARVEDPEQQKRLMSIILDDVQRLDRLISDISDASRLDAELSRADVEPVNLKQLVQALVEINRATLDESRARFTLSIPEHHDYTVPGMEGRLGQVVRNVISNAVTFSPEGGEIAVKLSRSKEAVIIVVSDSGPGIPEGKEEAIFDRFYCERPSGEKFGTHSGLGLSISKQIVEAHGGTIKASNRKNDAGEIIGARFEITLPRSL